MAFGGYYTTGTISVDANGTTVEGVGTLWSATGLIEEGDMFFANGAISFVLTVTDDTHIELTDPWTGGDLADANYRIIKSAPARYDPAITQQKIRDLLSTLGGPAGVIYTVTDEEPDPGLGEDGQYAIKTNTGVWKRWQKQDGVWVDIGIGGYSFPVALWVPGKPIVSEIVMKYDFTIAVSFAVALAGSKAIVGVAPTADAVFSVQKNNVQFGTITFLAGQTVGTLAAASLTSFAIGDVLKIVAPSPQDATLADISITLAGTR